MKIVGLTASIRDLEQFQAAVAVGDGARIYGLLDAAKAAVFAAVSGQAGPTLVVTPHVQDALDITAELEHWTDGRIAHFPPIESLPYERAHLDRSLLADREMVVRGILRQEFDVLVTPIRALLQPVPLPTDTILGDITLTVGGALVPERAVAQLLEMGYEETALVDEPGTFARRGGVLDVFAIGAVAPLRIEFFGNEIESLRTFDAVSQRSVSSIESVVIAAMLAMTDDLRLATLEELMSLDITQMSADARTRWLDDLAKLEAGSPLDELPLFAPYLLSNGGTLLEVLPNGSTIVVDSLTQVWAGAQELWEQAQERLRGLVEVGEVPPGLSSALVDPEHVREKVRSYRSFEFESGSPPAGGSTTHDWTGLFTPAKLYAGRLRSLVQDMATNARGSLIISTLQHERMKELCVENDLPVHHVQGLSEPPPTGITVSPVPINEGWTLPSRSLVLLSDHELFGRAKTRRTPRRARAAREAFFASFADGDYVVHLEHGIGQFQGVTRMAIDGAEREYALVQYAGADRVYVPSDQLERLTRYIGVSDNPPPLNKLGGGEWQRARQRAKRAAEDIARELLEIYAKRKARPGYAFGPDTPWQHELESSFPYPETPDQVRAIEDVKEDMEEPKPMDRLVCADVGYGKTEVAVRAAFKAVMDGRQVAVLVPTTILAQQHFETFTERYGPYPLQVEVLSRFRSPAQQRETLGRVALGETDVLIGTHRILQKDVTFKNLGLIIIDEEQRFGVKHKEALKKMRETIDVLTLTATPIPRTLHTTLVGIREISVIETPPEGRLAVRTYLQPFDERLLREAVVRELDRDGQVYLVHNKVATIEAMAERVRRVVPEARVLVAHGQMDETLLEKVMLDFAHCQGDVLVCSTIIENGLDIPNANTIVINNAHRLGLTQLYQLRGRVGRGANQAYAYLLYPQDVKISHDAARRMEAVFEAQDLGAGFSIAMKDLELRGAGNLLGAEQSGNAAAIGFDLYSRMVSEAIEGLRGQPVEEVPAVTIDLPLTRFLPAEYIGTEAERLTLYRRLAAVRSGEELDQIAAEMLDRFGPLPVPVENMVSSVRLKLLALSAGVTAIQLSTDFLTIRVGGTAIFDRVSLYKQFGTEAKISTNVLRIPCRVIRDDIQATVRSILGDMVRLHDSLRSPQAAGV